MCPKPGHIHKKYISLTKREYRQKLKNYTIFYFKIKRNLTHLIYWSDVKKDKNETQKYIELIKILRTGKILFRNDLF